MFRFWKWGVLVSLLLLPVSCRHKQSDDLPGVRTEGEARRHATELAEATSVSVGVLRKLSDQMPHDWIRTGVLHELDTMDVGLPSLSPASKKAIEARYELLRQEDAKKIAAFYLKEQQRLFEENQKYLSKVSQADKEVALWKEKASEEAAKADQAHQHAQARSLSALGIGMIAVSTVGFMVAKYLRKPALPALGGLAVGFFCVMLGIFMSHWVFPWLMAATFVTVVATAWVTIKEAISTRRHEACQLPS